MTLLFYECREAHQIYPWLLGLAIPIATVDVIRHNSESFNRFYVRYLGALMRETEVHDKYNGVIFYLLGTWIVLRFFPKDIAVMGLLLLSWCDTAASTFGRLYGRYTPRIRKGKSLAGSLAAATVGFCTCLYFYYFFVSSRGGIEPVFMFQGRLKLPPQLDRIGFWDVPHCELTGWPAYVVFSAVVGLIASFSEAVDLFDIDDNLTIPVLSAIGIWAFLRVFG